MGVFDFRRSAIDCLRALRGAGFESRQLGFAGPGVATVAPLEGDRVEADSTVVATATGSLAGGVLGSLVGGVVAGLVPGVGPIVTGGMLAGFVAGAPMGAAIGGLAASLRDAGAPTEVAEFYEEQIHAGRYLITVAGRRPDQAARIIAAAGGSVEGPLSRAVTRLTGSPPVVPEVVEGRFLDIVFAEQVAGRLGAAFPEREVTFDRHSRRVKVAARRT